MTKFNRDDFSYSGGYLMFHGDAGSQNEYYADDESVHPTRRGTRKELFVARFKYAAGDKARFLTFLINNFTPEEYFTARNTKNPTNCFGNVFSPQPILEAKGYVSATVRKGMKRAGYTVFTKETYREHMNRDVFDAGDHSEFWAEKDKEHAAILAACASAA